MSTHNKLSYNNTSLSPSLKPHFWCITNCIPTLKWFPDMKTQQIHISLENAAILKFHGFEKKKKVHNHCKNQHAKYPQQTIKLGWDEKSTNSIQFKRQSSLATYCMMGGSRLPLSNLKLCLYTNLFSQKTIITHFVYSEKLTKLN